MQEVFKGRIAVDGGGELEVDLHLSETTLTIESGDASICSLPLSEYGVATFDGRGFDLMVDGDSVHFVPDEPEAFSVAVAAIKSAAGGDEPAVAATGAEDAHAVPTLEPISKELVDDEGWVSEDIIESQRSLRDSKSIRRFTSANLKKAAIVGGALALVGVVAWQAPGVIASASFGSSFSTEETTTTTVAPTTTTTTSAPANTPTTTGTSTTVTVAETGVFSGSSNGFVDAWNAIGGPISPALRFPAYLPAGESDTDFTKYISISTVVDPSGVLESFTLSIDPSGPGNSDALGINCLGVVFAVTEPGLDGSGRKAALASLGFDVERPKLEGVDGEVVRAGIDYVLVYDNEMLTLTVSPAS